MAMSLANRALRDQNLGLMRCSLSLIRNFSTDSPSASSDSKKPKRRKKRNLFEVAQFLPNWGIGYHMAKTHWTDISYEVTKINLYKDGRHGKAWGIAHKDGLPIADAPKKMSGVHKRCWKYIANLTKLTESTPNLSKSIESTQSAEVKSA